jgi:hypothetical protein
MIAANQATDERKTASLIIGRRRPTFVLCFLDASDPMALKVGKESDKEEVVNKECGLLADGDGYLLLLQLNEKFVEAS